jgi:ATP-dependent DNA helicase RecG
VNDSLRGPVLHVLDAVLQRFEARNQYRELMHGLVRVPVPDYEPNAFREALNNAVLHRDYTLNNAIYIQWFNDEITIASPGGFLPGITVDNILSHEPRPRNRRLADAFQLLGLVERSGRGVDRIFEGQLRYGRAPADYSASDHNAVRLSLASGDASIELIQLIQHQRQGGRPFSLDELICIDLIRRERRADVAQLARAIQRPEGRARGVGEGLVERGILDATADGRRRVYRFSAATYRALGMEVEYVRSRGFDRIQQESLILEFLSSHGEIRRRDVVELCRIGEKEATRLLQRMVEQGRIIKHGDRKGAWYTKGMSGTDVMAGTESVARYVNRTLSGLHRGSSQDKSE